MNEKPDKFEVWASDLGKTKIIRLGAEGPEEDYSVWRQIYIGTQVVCEAFEIGYKLGYEVNEEGWD
jgi:hypothetical protein